MSILICFGTRPEYIKVKSLIDNLPNIKTCFTGQHKDLLRLCTIKSLTKSALIGDKGNDDHAFEKCEGVKDIKVDYELNMDTNYSNNRLNNIFCNILAIDHIFAGIEYVLVQGDTSTANAIALSAFNNEIKIIHLEAGLRSGDLRDPFPEEMNRQVIGRLADIHLCPTEFNKENLLKENVNRQIFVVGNTGLDNISKDGCSYNNQVLITMHRKDNHPIMDKWFETIESIAIKYSNLEFIIPLHPNPNVQKHRYIFKAVKVVDPMTHSDVISYLKQCKFVISDSGGLQEECSYLNKKIVVCRKTTERPESVGIHSFMCENPDKLAEIVDNIYLNYEIDAKCPYGDGNSWKNIIEILHL